MKSYLIHKILQKKKKKWNNNRIGVRNQTFLFSKSSHEMPNDHPHHDDQVYLGGLDVSAWSTPLWCTDSFQLDFVLYRGFFTLVSFLLVFFFLRDLSFFFKSSWYLYLAFELIYFFVLHHRSFSLPLDL